MLWKSLNIAIVGFRWGGQTRAYRAESLFYRFSESGNTIRLVDGERDTDVNYIDLAYRVSAKFTIEQVNAGTSYTLSNGSTNLPSTAQAGWTTLRNRIINNKDVDFLPLLDNGKGDVDTSTMYRIRSSLNPITISAGRAGFVDDPVTLEFFNRNPLSSYPSWAEY